MEFGRLTDVDFNEVDFTLPQDHPATARVLSLTPKKSEVYIGCAKWGRKDWIGKIYPDGTKESDFLSHYARFFNAIELNASFYRMPSSKQTAAWSKKVGSNFKFCPKVTGEITHMKRLKDVQKQTERFLEGVSGFGENLGPIFLMPHPGMGPKTLQVIETFLNDLPKDIRLFVELRHEQWFEDKETFEKVFDLLENSGVGSVITDASGRRDCVHMRLTTPQAFIRFVGNGLHPTDYARVDSWVSRINEWMQKGIHDIYFFMHQHEEIHSPELCKYVIEQTNLKCGTGLKVPVFIGEETTEAKQAAKQPRAKRSSGKAE
jgi:uncharacterized protein YecE (DUF72 family)